MSKKARVNDQITAATVLLIDADGSKVGEISIHEALDRAADAKLDLVEIASKEMPPVCRIMDHGKYLFEQKKRKKLAAGNQAKTKVKEIKIRPVTDKGDYEVKLRNLIRFLNDGDKVKVTVRFRGREVVHHELGLDLLKRIESDTAEVGIVEQFPKLEGRQMVMVLSPKKKK